MKVEVRATGLRGKREAAGWTQRELAKRLGVTQNYIPALELGNRNPGPKLRERIMELFDCSSDELFTIVMVGDNREQELTPKSRTA